MPLVAALIGAGGVAHHHARAYQLDDRVGEIWVVDTRWGVHEQFAQQYPKVSHTTTDYEDAVNADVVSFVDICLPHYLHHPVALMALRAGKHVVLEKPIAMTIEEATQMLEEAGRAERCLFVSMNQLAYPSHITVQQLLQEGVIGQTISCSGKRVWKRVGAHDGRHELEG
ncbi:MAG TPA: Gfo/Idh/MocA family oxidoreductase [Armatimonadetes bacterium]|nr:Gfo/Idh/MocA family oxidoreductase [Armatimonadota bacterium]